jgi:hypothetical protein
MEQSLHLLIVDRQRGAALASWHGSRWLLPIVRLPERVRAGPLLLRWAGERGITGQILGQWLGRAAPDNDAIDWLAVMDASGDRLTAPGADLQLTRLAELTSAAACVDYQRWATVRALSTSDLPATPGPFGTMNWFRDVQVWVGDVAGVLRDVPDAVVPFRTTAYEVVLGLHTTRGLLYFKGLTSDRTSEPELSAQLARIAPAAFPQTVALAKRSDGTAWWLTEACPGSPLGASASRRSVARVAAAHARVQQTSVRAIETGQLGALAPLALAPMAAWARDLLDRQDEKRQPVPGADVVDRACERVGTARVPHGWVAADFDPANVIVHGNDVRFIDLDDSVLGPAPIAIATFAMRMKRRGLEFGGDLYRSYERAWKPQLFIADRWRDFEIVSTLTDCYLGWKRVVEKTERQEIQGCLGLACAALARRLARGVAAGAA